MISRGSTDVNLKKAAEYGITFPVVLQQHWESSRKYEIFATPCAYLVDEKGDIAAEVAIGAEPILRLLIGAAILSLLKSSSDLMDDCPSVSS
jgi:hypothetical protein